MELNKEGREKLRKTIDEMISSYGGLPVKHCIKLKKKTLEDLMFDKCVDGAGHKYKKIAYTSPNLIYIDLCSLSFEDVSLNYDYDNEIDLRDCNVKIDFSKTYELRTKGYVEIRNMNLHGVDLSNNNVLDEHGVSILENARIIKSSLGDTGLKIVTKNIKCYKSNLISTDLSELTLSPYSALKMFDDTNVRYTNLTIDFRLDEEGFADKIVRNNNYVGCHIIRPDGKIVGVPTIGELTKTREALKESYDNFEETYINDVVASVKKQMKLTKELNKLHK